MAKRKIYTEKTPCGIRSLGATGRDGYSQNLLPYGTGLKKRNGWRVLHSFRDGEFNPMEINGIYEYRGEDKSCLIVRAGNNLYECNYDLTDIKAIGTIQGSRKRAHAHMYAGVLFLGGTDELVYYDGEGVKIVRDSSRAYVPTTSVGVEDTVSAKEPTSNEAPNLLTGQRINRLRGEKRDHSEYTYPLDAQVRYGTPFSLSAELRVRKSQEGESGNRTTDYIGKINGEVFGGIITVTFATDSLTESGAVALQGVVNEKGEAVILEGAELGCRVERDRVVLTFNAVAPEQRDNITVTFFSAEQSVKLSPELFATAVTDGAGSCMLFSCGTNKIYSLYEEGNLLYVPSDGVMDIGQRTEKISAILPMTNGYLGIYKETGFYTARQTGKGLVGSRCYESSDSHGSINSFVSNRLGYDCISFCREGVFGIDEIENAEYQISRLCHRSASIQEELSSFSYEEMKNACAAIFENKYYLFIGERAYVADMNFTVSLKNGRYGYEWWRLDSCPCRIACVVDGRLYMGRENGDVAAFDESYTDRDFIVLRDKDLNYSFYNNEGATVAVFDSKIKIKSGDKVCLPEVYTFFGQCHYGNATAEISISSDLLFDNEGYSNLYEGMEVMLLDDNGYSIYRGEILKTDVGQCTISCGSLSLDRDRSFWLYIKRGENTEYELKKEGYDMLLCLNKKPVKLYDTDVKWVYVKRESQIECALSTSSTDLGEVGDKSLLAITVSVSNDTKCSLTVGYETSKNTYSRQLTVGTGIDFDSLDFAKVSFASRMKKRVRIACLERSFDYVRLCLSSNEGQELLIDGVSLDYAVK